MRKLDALLILVGAYLWVVYCPFRLYTIQENHGDPSILSLQVLSQRVAALANIARADGRVDPRERVYIMSIVEGARVSADPAKTLASEVDKVGDSTVDWEAFSDPDDAAALLQDIGAVATLDGVVHPTERDFLDSAAEHLGPPCPSPPPSASRVCGGPPAGRHVE